jgi:hypothetical protein
MTVESGGPEEFKSPKNKVPQVDPVSASHSSFGGFGYEYAGCGRCPFAHRNSNHSLVGFGHWPPYLTTLTLSTCLRFHIAGSGSRGSGWRRRIWGRGGVGRWLLSRRNQNRYGCPQNGCADRRRDMRTGVSAPLRAGESLHHKEADRNVRPTISRHMQSTWTIAGNPHPNPLPVYREREQDGDMAQLAAPVAHPYTLVHA